MSETCRACGGTRECPRCDGTGEIDSGGFGPRDYPINVDCPDCHGSGDCPLCGGYAFADDPAPTINAVRTYLTRHLIKACNERRPLTVSRALGNCIGWLLIGIQARRSQWIVCIARNSDVGGLNRNLYLVRAATEAEARSKIQKAFAPFEDDVHIGVKWVRDEEEIQTIWSQPRQCSG